MSKPAPVLLGVAALLVLSMPVGLVLQSGGRHGFVALACAQAALYGVAAYAVIKHGASRRVLVACLAAAALMRAVALVAPPALSTDVYRYVWDGRVQGAGINPYRYVPANPALADLRDDAIYPNINRKDYARTIYPPGAQMIFFLVTRLAPSVTAMKLAMVGFEAVTVLLLIAMLRRAGLPDARVLLYALHPLPAWEFAGSGHVDAAMIAFTCLALWLHQRGRTGASGAALALASLVKPFPPALAPALYRRWDWRMPGAFILVAVAAYAPYLGVGAHVLGFLPTYLREEGLETGIAFYPLWLLRTVLPVPTAAYLVGVAVALLACAGVVVFRGERADVDRWRDALRLAGAFLFLTSPHFPWYLAWLLPLACLDPWVPALWLVSTSFLLYLPVEFALVGSIAYGGFAILALADRLRPLVLVPQEKSDVIGCAR